MVTRVPSGGVFKTCDHEDVDGGRLPGGEGSRVQEA